MLAHHAINASQTDLDFRPAREEDLDRLADVLAHAFGFPRDDAKPWFVRAKMENVRVLEREKRIVGGLFEIPMGQYFGGASVSTMGVAAVAIAPEERGRGSGAQMMIAMLREARSQGFALSTLYPATITLYRRAGYERAGARFETSFDPRQFEVAQLKNSPGGGRANGDEMTTAQVEGTPDDLKALYTTTARRCPGYMDRGPYVWDRVSKPRGLVTKTFTVSHAGKLEGYVVVAHVMGERDSKVTVTDVVATNERSARAILRLLVEYRSLAVDVKWYGGPTDVFTNLLPERHVEARLVDYFLVRVLDVTRAMTMRGWPRGASGSLVIELADASMPENSGRYLLTLENGRASVSPTTKAPDATISERGLAALYTGYAQAHVALDCGWLDAGEEARAQLDAWFGGPLPTMRDGF